MVVEQDRFPFASIATLYAEILLMFEQLLAERLYRKGFVDSIPAKLL